MIRAIAIDDELPALKVIENFCSQVDFITLLRTFNKPGEALKFIRGSQIDPVFLDINIPSQSGIHLYKAVQQNTMAVFTTAYSEYAVEGFNVNAIDYLLKPFTFERFMQAAQKANEYYTRLQVKEQLYILIRADYSLVKINISDILFIEGLDDYLKIHLQQQKPVVARMTMKAILEKLPAGSFIRVHRSYIVPFNRIEQVRNKIITLAGEEIPIGISYEEIS